MAQMLLCLMQNADVRLPSMKVSGVNDAPALELDLDSYAFEEDTEDYVSLGPLFVSDSDAGASA